MLTGGPQGDWPVWEVRVFRRDHLGFPTWKSCLVTWVLIVGWERSRHRHTMLSQEKLEADTRQEPPGRWKKAGSISRGLCRGHFPDVFRPLPQNSSTNACCLRQQICDSHREHTPLYSLWSLLRRTLKIEQRVRTRSICSVTSFSLELSAGLTEVRQLRKDKRTQSVPGCSA